jgi:hypothetical protein
MVQSVIIDTDFSTDVGDFGGVNLACIAHKLGYINLLGVIVCTTATKTVGAACAVAEWWGITGLQYGVWKGYAVDAANSAFVTDLYDNFPHAAIGLSATVQDSTVAYRTLLASAADGSVDIVTIGYGQTLSALRQSVADGISPLTGQQLISAKVRRVWTMGGQYPGPNGAEWNFKGGLVADTNITTAWADIATSLPVPWYLVGFEAGTFTAGGTSGKAPTDIGYHAYTAAGYTSGRTAWDELPVLMCIQNGTDFVFTRGTNSALLHNPFKVELPLTPDGVMPWPASPGCPGGCSG